MKFKYKLGERVLFKKTNGEYPYTETVGTVTGITWSTTGVTYQLNEDDLVEDSDILGTVTVKRTLTRAKRRKSDPQADLPISNGKLTACSD